ncbi:MAG: chorismate synthase [Myxococcaceae bacterium]|nr:MAG: chorismate synthase [Myxococcaceae bacterium]
MTLRRLRALTAGESHGPGLLGILEGLPAGLPLTSALIDRDLARRQKGYGRGGRMRIEQDAAEILAGVRFGETLGSPLGLLIRNRDWENWTERMSPAPGGPDPRPVQVPRPGHTDLAGALKYGRTADLRDILERASARETAMRVALGAAARALLRELGIQVGSYVRSIGTAEADAATDVAPELLREDAEALALRADETETRALTAGASDRLVQAIQEAQRRRDTLGGVIEVIATGVPPGLGSHVQADRKLDGRLGGALLSIQAIKAVEIGDGIRGGRAYGSETHDPIVLSGDRLSRTSNHAGGLEGGITNGEPVVLRAVMKPISTVPAALPSVHLGTLELVPAHVERSDTCAVPAAGVVTEAVLALALADALLEALGGDTMDGLRPAFARLRLSARTGPGHVWLVGPMGSGKTEAGRRLAVLLGLPFVDLDAIVEERAGRSVAELFRAEGEPRFRALEAEAVGSAAKGPAAVVGTGGGVVLGDGAWRAMRSSGVVLGLTARKETLLARLAAQTGHRPLLAGEACAALGRLLGERRHLYRRADLTLDTEGLSPDGVAGALVGLLRSLQGPLVRPGATP